MRFKGGAAVESFRMYVARRSEQVMYTSPIFMVCYAMDSRSKNRFRVDGGDFVTPPVLNLDRPSDHNA